MNEFAWLVPLPVVLPLVGAGINLGGGPAGPAGRAGRRLGAH